MGISHQNEGMQDEISQQSSSSADRQQSSRFFGNRIVKQEFQHKFSIFVLAAFSLIIFINWMVGKLMINHMLEMGLIDAQQGGVHLNTLNQIVVKSSCLGLIVLYGVTLFYSHYIAGPIYRIEKVLEKISTGDISMQVNLRKYDEFKEVGELLNQALIGLRGKIDFEKKQIAEKLQSLENLALVLRQKGLNVEADQIEKIASEISNTSAVVTRSN